MGDFQYTSDLLHDVLFRASEPTDGTSDFQAAALTYLNRAYQAVWLGGSELEPSLHEEWWWLRRLGLLTLLPPRTTGTVSVTQNSLTVTFSSAPASSQVGAFFTVDGQPDTFRIATHTAGQAGATLDSVYTGPTAGAATYALRYLEYDLPLPTGVGLLRLIAPMRLYRLSPQPREAYRVWGMDLGALEGRWPLALVEGGVPEAFAMVSETRARFNRWGPTSSTDLIRVEFEYLQRPAALANTANEEPLVPWPYRKVLADAALMWLLLDKQDSRAETAGLMAKSGLAAMARAQRHTLAGLGRSFGQIRPRQTDLGRRPWRDSAGIILG